MSGGHRKRRSDRKRDIKPTVSLELRECIYRLAYITDAPVKDVSEAIVINGFSDPKVMEYLSEKFVRDIHVGNTIYRKRTHFNHIAKRSDGNQTARISIRFKLEDHDVISSLAYAMDCTVSRACALLLDASVRNGEFIDEFVKSYLTTHLDRERVSEIKRVLKYINANNPYDETYTWASLLSLMMEEVRDASAKVTDVANDFVIKHWRD